GCHNSDQCAADQYCDTDLTCKAGCDATERCPAGQVCREHACVAGCRDSSECALGQRCDGGQEKCIAGCATDDSGSAGDPTRCPDKKACGETVTGNQDWQCTDICTSGMCGGESDGYACYGDDADASYCRQGCDYCSGAQACTVFAHVYLSYLFLGS